MATITQLHEEIITIILENKTITMEDIVNFKYTCKRFWQITLTCKFWEKKFYQSCPTAERKYNKEKQNKVLHHINLERKMQAGLHYIQELQYFANVVSENKLNNTDVENLMRLLCLIIENSMTYYFVRDEINFAQKSRKLFFNLTHKYAFKRIFNCLKQCRFLYKQVKLMNMPKTKNILEKQLTIVAQYFAPHISYSGVKAWLNGITQTVLSHLKIKYPSHSICSTALEQFSYWRNSNIEDNFWNETESNEIMCVLEEYIFSKLEIHKLHQVLKTTDIEAKYIQYFAESFQRHLLIITYHIIARRLGVRCYLIKYKNNIGIMCEPKYYTSIWYDAEIFYLSPFNLPYPSNIIRKLYQNVLYSEETVKLFNDISVTIFIMEDYFSKLKYHKYGNDYNFIFSLLYQYFAEYKYIAEYMNIENIYEIIITNSLRCPSTTLYSSLRE